MVGIQSKIKSAVLRKRVLASLMVTGVLVTCAGFGQTVQADDGKIYASGGEHTYTVADSTETGTSKQVTNIIIGGWEYQDGEINGSKNQDISLDKFTSYTDKDKTAHTTINSGTFAGVVGGDLLSEPSQNVNNLEFCESAVTINGGTVGESTVNGVAEATIDEAIVGGNKITYYGSTDNASGRVDGITAQTTTDKTTVTLNGGLVNAPIFAGSMIMNYGQYTQTSNYIANDKNTNLVLKGGAVNNFYGQEYQNHIDQNENDAVAVTYTTNEVYGGGAVIGYGQSNVTNANIVADGFGDDAHYAEIFGGGYAAGGGTATVDNTTITLRNVKNVGVIAGGKAMSGNFQVPALVDGKYVLQPLFSGIDKFYNVDTSTINTTSYVKNATINMESGQVWMMWLGGEAPDNDFVSGATQTLKTDNVTLNYKDGTINGEITVPASTKKTTINLYKDLVVANGDEVKPITIMARGVVGGDDNSIANIDKRTYLTINGNNHNLTANLVTDSDGDYSKPVDAILSVNNVKLLKGDLNASEYSRVQLTNVSGYEGTLSGSGVIELNSSMNLTDKAVFNGDNISIKGGKYEGTYNLQKDVIVDAGTVSVKNFATDLLGPGILTFDKEGQLETTADQLFGANEGNTTLDKDAVTGLPTTVAKAVDDKVHFIMGSVILDADNGYTLAYAEKALEALRKSDSTGTNINDMKLTMKGKILDKSVTFDTIKQLNQNLVLDSATIDGTTEQNPNLIIKGNDSSIVNTGSTLPIDGMTHDATVLDKGFSAGALNLKAGSIGVIVSGQETLGLGGSQGGELITVDGKTPTNMIVSVGTGAPDENAVGTLAIGNGVIAADTKYILPAEVDVYGNSSITTNGIVTVTNGIVLAGGGSIDAQTGSVTSDVYVTSGGTGVITGTLIIPELELEEGIASDLPSALQIGARDKTATVTINQATLNGATVIMDPSWDSPASEVAINFTKTNNGETTNFIDGKLMIGQNTYATIGDSLAAKSMFQNTGLTFGENGITAALYIQGNQALGSTGAVYVDGSKTDSQLASAAANVAAGSFTAGANSITMVDGSATTSKAALSGVTSASIDSSAKLYINDAQGGNTYHILVNDGTNTISGIDTSHWTNANILTNKSLVELTGVYDGNTAFDVTAVTKKMDDVYDDKGVIDDIGDKTINGDTNSAAYKFFTNATDSNINATKEAQLDAINGMANMTGLSGITWGAYTTSNLLSDSTVDHVSLVHPLTHDKDVWARLIHTKDSVDGLTLGGMDGTFDNKYNGVVVGADLYHQNDKTAGVAISYLDGSTSGHTLATSTSTDSKYYGLGFYGRADKGDYALLGDVTYTHGSHDITQYNSALKVTGSTDTDAFSVGIRGEKRIAYGDAALVPYVGARYVHLSVGDYTNSIGLHYDQSDSNLFLLPVGVKYSADYEHGDWTYRPVAELGYVWNLGGNAVDQTVSLDGTAAGFQYDVTDRGSFIGKLGLEATKGDVTYGLSYEYQKGSNVQSSRYDAKVNFRF